MGQYADLFGLLLLFVNWQIIHSIFSILAGAAYLVSLLIYSSANHHISTLLNHHIDIAFTLFIICTPCTKAAPPLIAAATCTASIICASL
jgi:hypothetical protein